MSNTIITEEKSKKPPRKLKKQPISVMYLCNDCKSPIIRHLKPHTPSSLINSIGKRDSRFLSGIPIPNIDESTLLNRQRDLKIELMAESNESTSTISVCTPASRDTGNDDDNDAIDAYDTDYADIDHTNNDIDHTNNDIDHTNNDIDHTNNDTNDTNDIHMPPCGISREQKQAEIGYINEKICELREAITPYNALYKYYMKDDISCNTCRIINTFKQVQPVTYVTMIDPGRIIVKCNSGHEIIVHTFRSHKFAGCLWCKQIEDIECKYNIKIGIYKHCVITAHPQHVRAFCHNCKKCFFMSTTIKNNRDSVFSCIENHRSVPIKSADVTSESKIFNMKKLFEAHHRVPCDDICYELHDAMASALTCYNRKLKIAVIYGSFNGNTYDVVKRNCDIASINLISIPKDIAEPQALANYYLNELQKRGLFVGSIEHAIADIEAYEQDLKKKNYNFNNTYRYTDRPADPGLKFRSMHRSGYEPIAPRIQRQVAPGRIIMRRPYATNSSDMRANDTPHIRSIWSRHTDRTNETNDVDNWASGTSATNSTSTNDVPIDRTFSRVRSYTPMLKHN